jgi:hypothetical protein
LIDIGTFSWWFKIGGSLARIKIGEEVLLESSNWKEPIDLAIELIGPE